MHLDKAIRTDELGSYFPAWHLWVFILPSHVNLSIFQRMWVVLSILFLLCPQHLPTIRIQSKRYTCCHGTKIKCELFRSWHALIQFNLEIIETCVLETCGQITKENQIRRDLIELHQAMKKPIMASGPQTFSKWRQVISKDVAHRYN